MKFAEMPYKRPDLASVLADCEALTRKIRAAATAEELLALYREENACLAHYRTAQVLANIHYTQDTRDAAWSAEQDWFDENGPAVASAEAKIAKALLEKPHTRKRWKRLSARGCCRRLKTACSRWMSG